MADRTVGVVIPTRDRADLLIECIRSVLAQSRPPDQIVVVDDCSLDAVELPNEMTDHNIEVVRCPRNVGPAEARNIGMRHLETELVAFIDDDDRWKTHKLARQLELARSPNAFVTCDFEVVPQKGRTEVVHVPREIDSLRRSLLLEPSLPPSVVLAERQHILSAGAFDPEMRIMEDWDLWLRLADTATLHVVREVLVTKAAHRGAAEERRTYARVMRRRLQPHLSALTSKERARVEAHHDVMGALLALETGNRWKGMRALGSCLIRSRSRIALQGILRGIVGEKAWTRVQRIRRGTPSVG